MLSRDAFCDLTTASMVCVEATPLISQAIAKSHGADREFKILKKHCRITWEIIMFGMANVGLLCDGQFRFSRLATYGFLMYVGFGSALGQEKR